MRRREFILGAASLAGILGLGLGWPRPPLKAKSGMRTYDPRNVVVTFNGVRIKDFADGTFIGVEYHPRETE